MSKKNLLMGATIIVMVLLLVFLIARDKSKIADLNRVDLGNDTEQQAEERRLANVDSVEIVYSDTFPLEVDLVAKGFNPDGCTSVSGIERTGFDDTTFYYKVYSVRPEGVACIEVITPFEVTTSVNVLGLKAGTYYVDVNGVKTSFELPVDNVAGAEFDKG